MHGKANVKLIPSWRLQMTQDDADGNVACRGTDASWEAVGHDSNTILFKWFTRLTLV
jgi:hypothetical protein